MGVQTHGSSPLKNRKKRAFTLRYFGDIFYMTVITLTTLGYREVIELNATVYTWGELIDYFVTRRLADPKGEKKMLQTIQSLKGHIIIAGLGRVGKQAALELQEAGQASSSQPEVMRTRANRAISPHAIRVQPKSQAIGESMRSLQVRDRSGASVLVVFRGNQIFPNPSADLLIEGGDRLLALGTQNQLELLEKLIE